MRVFKDTMLNLSAAPYISQQQTSAAPAYYYHPNLSAAPWTPHNHHNQQKQHSTYMQQQQPTPPSSSNMTTMNIPHNNTLLQEEITTIFVVGFPNDMHEREFQNMFIFSPGFEAATIKIPTFDEIDHCSTGQHKKQIIGFAKFRTRLQALEARDILSGRKVDAEKGSVLKAEMAKKNLHTKRGLSNEFFHPAFQQYGIINMQLSANAQSSSNTGVPAYTGATTGTGTLFTQPPMNHHQQMNFGAAPPPTLESLFAPSVVSSPKVTNEVIRFNSSPLVHPKESFREHEDEIVECPRYFQQGSQSLPSSPVQTMDPSRFDSGLELMTDQLHETFVSSPRTLLNDSVQESNQACSTGMMKKPLSINTSLANRWIKGLAPATATAILTNPMLTPQLPPCDTAPSTTTAAVAIKHPTLTPPQIATKPDLVGGDAAVYFPKDKLPLDLINSASAMVKELPGYRRVVCIKEAVLIEFEMLNQATAARHWVIHVLENLNSYEQSILVVAKSSILNAQHLGTEHPNVVAADQLLDLSRSATL